MTVEPSGIEFSVAAGETIFDAASRHGYKWPTVCGGLGTCRTCTLTVIEGAQNFQPVSDWEAEGLAEIDATWRGVDEPRRMACQAKISGDVRVRKPGVRPATTASG